jgi:hypothetical protein
VAISAVVLVGIIGVYLVVTGLLPTTTVYLADYSVMKDHNVITILTGNTSSMGYIRGMSDVSDDPQKMELQFYSAFGGLNSSLGARNVFVLHLKQECTEIYMRNPDGFHLVLQKNPQTGQWQRP